MKYRTTPKRPGARPYVEHSTEAGKWCGPVIPRAVEIPCALICMCCGEFCEDAPPNTVKTVKRLDRTYQRERETQAALARAKNWGLTADQAAALFRKPVRFRAPKADQLSLFEVTK